MSPLAPSAPEGCHFSPGLGWWPGRGSAGASGRAPVERRGGGGGGRTIKIHWRPLVAAAGAVCAPKELFVPLGRRQISVRRASCATINNKLTVERMAKRLEQAGRRLEGLATAERHLEKRARVEPEIRIPV